MNNEIQVFTNSQFGDIRVTITENNEPMFCLVDVCKMLDLGNPSQVKARLNPNGVHLIQQKGVTNNEGVYINKLGNTATNFINTPNLYKCIFQSRKPEAERFQDWVYEEVLPSIQENGGYMISRPEDSEEDIMARAIVIANATIERKNKKIEEQRLRMKEKDLLLENANETITRQAPKVDYYDNVLMSADTMTTTQVAKSIGRSCRWLNTRLKECGLIYYQSGQWMLKSPYDSWNLHKVRTATFTHTDGTTATKTSTVWNERGRRFIVALSQCDFKIKAAVKLIKGELQGFPA